MKRDVISIFSQHIDLYENCEIPECLAFLNKLILLAEGVSQPARIQGKS